MPVNKSASYIGSACRRETGRIVKLWIGANSNTGELIGWYLVAGVHGKAKRVTGRNLTRLADELSEAFDEGNAEWVDEPSAQSLETLKSLVHNG